MNHWYKFIIPLFALAFLLVSCGKQAPSPMDIPAEPMPESPSPEAQVLFDGEFLSGKHTVVLHTNKGDITMELDADAAPKTVTNFIMLAKAGKYDNLTFHRVLPDFMIQGGDPNGDGTGGESIYGPTFEDEINANSYGLDTKMLRDAAEGQPLPPEFENLTVKEFYVQKGYVYSDSLQSLPMKKASVAMANSGANTNGSQFFIIQGENTPWLEGRHTVFGQVTDGMDVVDTIANVERDEESNKPTEPVTFTVEIK